jgi:hypothetical protein
MHPVIMRGDPARPWLAMLYSGVAVLVGAAVFGVARPSDVAAQATRDSAGVRIVENMRPALPAARAWRVDPRPTLEIGGLSGDSLYEFLRVMGVVKLSDGRIAVANQGSSTIRFFDATGKFVGSAGRSGRGPGEFQQILGMQRMRGDTLVVIDLGEVEYFTAEGQFVRQGASRAREGEGGGHFVFPAAVMVDGSFVGVAQGPAGVPPAGLRQDSVRALHVSASGDRGDSIAVLPFRIVQYDGKTPFGIGVVFSPVPVFAAVPQGFLFGYGDRYELRRYSPSGTLQAIIRRDDVARPVTGRDETDYRAWLRNLPGEDGRPRPPAMRERVEQMMRSIRFSEHVPAFASILADRRGNAWVEDYDPTFATSQRPGPSSLRTQPIPTEWDVFDPEGRWLCTVTMPANFTPLDVGNDYVAGLARDSDDVEYVRLYRLVKP